MSVNVNDFRFSIFINNDSAKKALIDLETEVSRLKGNLSSLEKEGKKDTDQYRSYAAALKEAETKMAGLRKEAGLNALSIRELQSLKKQLNNEFARAIPGTDKRKKLEAELQAVNARLKEVTMNAGQVGKTLSFSGVANSFNKYFGVVTAAIASLTGVVFGLKKAVEAFNEFEKKLDNLSALTGLTGEELEWLGQQAKDLSTATLEGGVRITQSADAIVDAYTKVGSARPELLKNKEALNQVTQEAIILSEAANGELQPAVEALAMVLNQFNAPAEDSRRIINALAAGSKEGAGEIPYLTQAIEKSGTVAADVGMSYEQLIGTIETLAPRITQPEIAGRSLKGVILDLQKTADDTNPAIVGFGQAIENLGKKQLSTNELMKIFGSENITTAKILINNQEETKRYTDAVTGTNVALEQAAINTDNNASKLDQARNAAKLVAIELGQKLSPAMTAVTGWGTKILKAISALIDIFAKYKSYILSAAIGITVYTIAVKGAEIAQKGYELATKLATIATRSFNTALKSNPIGLIAAVVATAISALIAYSRTVDKVSEGQKTLIDTTNAMKESAKKYSDQLSDEKTKMNILFGIAKDENKSKEERKKAIDELNNNYSQYLGNLLSEKTAIEDIDAIQKQANASLEQSIKIKLAEEDAMTIARSQKELTERIKGLNLYKTAVQEVSDLFNADKDNWKKGIDFYINQVAEGGKAYVKNAIKKYGGSDSPGLAIINITKEINANRTALESLNSEFNRTNESYDDLFNKIKSEDTDTEPPKTPFSNNSGKSKAEIDAENKLKAEIEFQKRKAEIEQQIYEMTLEGEDKEIASAMQKYDQLFELALEHGVDITELQTLQAREIALIHKKYEDQEIQDQKDAQEKKAKSDKEAYEKELQDLKDAEQKKRDARTKTVEAIMDIQNSLATFVSTLKNQELADAEGNEKKQKEIKKKYADIELAINIARIGSETALAAIKAYTSMVGVSRILAILAAAASVAVGGVQIYAATRERNRIKGLEKGLYPEYMMATRAQDGKKFISRVSRDTSTRMVNEPTILVGEQGRKGLPELIIDGQTLKRLEINAPMAIQAIAHEAGKTHGFEKGFYDNLKNIGNRSQKELEVLERFSNVMEKAISDGLYTKLSIYDLEKSQNKYNDAKKTFS